MNLNNPFASMRARDWALWLGSLAVVAVSNFLGGNVDPLTLIAADSMDEYNKPDLSHVISQNQRADDLTRQTAGAFAEQFNLRLFPYTWVTDIDANARLVKAKDKTWQYDKLVLATGASAFVPPVEGRELMVTLNSQQAYQASETELRDATRVMIVGGGLIGTELAMDFCRAGKSVTLVDHAASILSALMPAEVSSRLQHRLTDMGVHLLLKSQLQSLSKTGSGIRVTLDRSRSVEVDVVIAATGLRPETAVSPRWLSASRSRRPTLTEYSASQRS